MTTYDEPTLHEALAARIAERDALDNLLDSIEHTLGCEREELLQTVNTVLTEREEALEILEALEVAFTCERKDLLASVKEFIGDSMKLIDRCATAEAALDKINKAIAESAKRMIFGSHLNKADEPDMTFEEEIDSIFPPSADLVGPTPEKADDFRAEVPGFDGAPDSPPIGPTVRPPGLTGASLAADFMAGKLGLVIRSGNTARFVELED